MTARFPDWASLDVTERRQISAHAGEFARALDVRLKAFVAFEDAMLTPASGALAGMPYAAKDIFASDTRIPHGGLAQPLPMASRQQAAVLDLLDRVGARRIGYTAMTELAYEPSGYNAVHGAPKNPWSFDFITGGSKASANCISRMPAERSQTGGSSVATWRIKRSQPIR
jgi:aspartyl-tRNA(Asn)/glutamyl-tRNA(Gln) amidotransferase subunit A